MPYRREFNEPYILYRPFRLSGVVVMPKVRLYHFFQCFCGFEVQDRFLLRSIIFSQSNSNQPIATQIANAILKFFGF